MKNEKRNDNVTHLEGRAFNNHISKQFFVLFVLAKEFKIKMIFKKKTIFF